MKFKFSAKLALVSLIGNIILAIGIATCRISQMGIDPFTSMNTGVSNHLPIALGTYQASFNIVLFIVLVLLSRKNLKYLNIGAIINMFLLGYFVQFFNSVYCSIFGQASPDDIALGLPMSIVALVIGVLLLTLGCSLYITADLGTASYDALSIYMADVLPIKYSFCRIITDTACVAIALISGGPLGVATIVLMFGTGPFISFWNENVSKPIVKMFS
ncbi:MAG: hypothetical protein KBT48_05260 [Firmicutes bacterium]|nr:hypothetical protein [Bacillota bacterium]